MNSPASDSGFNCKLAEAPRRLLTLSLHERPQIGEIDLLIDHPKHGDCVNVGCIYIDNAPGTLPLNEAQSLADIISGRFNSHAALVDALEKIIERIRPFDPDAKPGDIICAETPAEKCVLEIARAALKSAT